MHFLNKYFLLSDHHTHNNEVAHWRVSALRIISSLVMLLCFGVAWHTFTTAVELDLLYIVVLTFSFLTISAGLVLASKRFYKQSAHALLAAIVIASICMNLFLTDLELAKVGSMYMYSCPIIALMLLGNRTATFYAVLNIVPFYMIINNIDLSNVTGIAQQLPSANLYITGLIFLFFNICIPLAVARTIVAAKRLNKSMSVANSLLIDKNELYKTFFTESDKAKIIVDEHFNITDANKCANKLFAVNKKQISKGIDITSLVPELNVKTNNMSQVIQHKRRFLRANYLVAMNKNYRVYEFYDCTQEQIIKQNLANIEQENKRLKYRNPQTKLPNKHWFEMQCERLITKYQRGFYIVVAQTANSEYLKLKLAQQDSQALLINAYKRLKIMPDGPFLCAHIGAGKLAFIIGTQSHDELKTKILPTIKHALDETYKLNNARCQQNFMFGYAHYPQHGQNSAEVLTNASSALKHATKSEPLCGYDEKLSQAFLEKYEISMLLDEALLQGDLSVHYQPKVTASGECIGLEALARWDSPILGVVSPSVFIPIAEEYAMVSRLTDLIIQKVCSQIADWSQKGLPTVPVAINISLLDFSQADFMSKLVKYLADFNIKPHQIELELTETSLEANQAHSLELIHTLQSWGFIISVDDFGVGYSNIARLAEYPINKLKLDRSLISQVTTSTRQKSLVKAVHVMCEELDIKCVAEGVETPEQVTVMAQMGCKEFQGFYFAKPMPAKRLEAHINRKGLVFSHVKSKELNTV
ncbi:putative bifunctional diguanylate cyclase/phosphodiesterase [Pseudoalteromonas carrageenovora]|uniref:putative bifunctional diguanylate cyclase/phosphodiesterase n=1 Tax=Pseudoalteromonas carrageenovora TaxID=227 RepID=UPI0026E324F3|nr:EAL domain-containing protein [Pseudoalteromonas carrageenovora]MDO6549154.1 EAL domain-containing protein [Pseudoalteromonas carrageenovora]MDO6833716.1 EAL domain-containing protein [Pseudoalteromonas carrageenovora]